ncbi:hypothetical protein BaRGS_00030065, partial [Batillaria attramentaria]
ERTTLTGKYGGGSGYFFLYVFWECSGTEPSLRDCFRNGIGSYSDGIGQRYCTYDNDVGVECG